MKKRSLILLMSVVFLFGESSLAVIVSAITQSENKSEKIIEETHDELMSIAVELVNSKDTTNIDEILKEAVSNEAVKVVAEEVEGIDDKQLENLKDSQYINDMQMEAENNMQLIQEEIAKAEANHEKMYTQEELLAMPAEEIGIPKEELAEIKSKIISAKIDEAIISATAEKVGGKTQEAVEKIEETGFKIPKSMIYIEKEDSKNIGEISGGGWPYCLDNNGWGYRNFISSDCYVVLYWYGHCWADFTPWRYCKAYKKNCSPILGHSKYNHGHNSWWRTFMW